MTGYSPFQGETHQETFLNVSQCDYDFDDDLFDPVSQEVKDFIEQLLVKVPRSVKRSECGGGGEEGELLLGGLVKRAGWREEMCVGGEESGIGAGGGE